MRNLAQTNSAKRCSSGRSGVMEGKREENEDVYRTKCVGSLSKTIHLLRKSCPLGCLFYSKSIEATCHFFYPGLDYASLTV